MPPATGPLYSLQSTYSQFVQQRIPHFPSIRSSFPKLSLSRDIPFKNTYVFLTSHIRAISPVHIPRFNNFNSIWRTVQIMRRSLSASVHHVITCCFVQYIQMFCSAFYFQTLYSVFLCSEPLSQNLETNYMFISLIKI